MGAEPIAVAAGALVRCGPVVVTVRPVPADDAPRSVVDPLGRRSSGPVPFYRSPVELPGPQPADVPVPAGRVLEDAATPDYADIARAAAALVADY